MRNPIFFVSHGWIARIAAAALGLTVSVAPAWAQFDTATGSGALQSVVTGKGDTADGFDAMGGTTRGSYNTAVGANALLGNKTGSRSTAVGANSLHDSDGSDNTACGYNALFFTVNGAQNTAFGSTALTQNNLGYDNTAIGFAALTSNTTGTNNTAIGESALSLNLFGTCNTADGAGALAGNIKGNFNTACGAGALSKSRTGDYNTGAGEDADFYMVNGAQNTAILPSGVMGSGNVDIGYSPMAGTPSTSATNGIYLGNVGSASDGSVIDIGFQGTQTVTVIAGIYGAAAANGAAVYINSNGQLGTSVSSARFKDDIHDMGDASRKIFSLRPVAFRYKPEIDPKGVAQFGLVAEEVEKIDPALVVHDPDGKPYSVRYEQVNAMLLNEFLKQHQQVQEHQAVIASLEAAGARQQSDLEGADAQWQSELKAVEARHRDQMAALKAALQAQAAMIQQVSTEAALGQPATRTASNSR